MTIILKLHGLEKVLSDVAVDELSDMQATLILLSSMNNDLKLQVQSEQSARDILAYLDRQYADRSEATKHRLLSEFLKCTKRPEDSIGQHIAWLKEMRAALKNLNEEYSDEFFQVIVINSLPAEYGDLLGQWEMMHHSMKTTAFLESWLRQKEVNLESRANMVLAVSCEGRKSWAQMSVRERKLASSCRTCGKRGHWAKECPSRGEKTDTAKSIDISSAKVNVLFNAGRFGSGLKDKWILDSGATQHMSNNRNWFTKLTMFSSPKCASIGDGQEIEVWGHGSIDVQCQVGVETVSGTLTDVSFIPKLATNLVSVGAMSRRGIATRFEGNKCLIYGGGRKLMHGRRTKDGLYVLDIKILKNHTTSLEKMSRPVDELHQVLGHVGRDRLDAKVRPCGALRKKEVVDLLSPSRVTGDADEVGDRVHIGLGFITNKAKPSYDYYLLCRDEASAFCFIYFVEWKTELVTKLAQLIVDFEHGSGRRIMRIVSDGGSEFIYEEAKPLFRKERIVHESSSQPNGIIDREMRAINTMARLMLSESGLVELAGEALRMACFIKNRTVSSPSGRTPYELFIGRKPNVACLAKFGTQVHVVGRDHQRNDLDAINEFGYLTGFSTSRNTFRVFVPKLNRVVEAPEVVMCPQSVGFQRRDSRSKAEGQVEEVEHTIRMSGKSPTEAEAIYRSRAGDDAVAGQAVCRTSGVQIGDISSDEIVQSSRRPVDYSPSDDGVRTVVGPSMIIPEEMVTVENHGPDLGLGVRPDLSCSYNEATPETGVAGGQTVPGDEDETQAENVALAESRPPSPPHKFSGLLVGASDIKIPASFADALNGPDAAKWTEAVNEELRAHRENNTWNVVERPKSGRTLSTRWVFSLKRDRAGNIERYKARLVARGFEQRLGIDVSDTYAPVPRIETIRTVLSLATINRYQIRQFDIETAFLNVKLTEDIYLVPPPGLGIPKSKCLKLSKALYGLRQAPKAWNQALNEALESMGFKQLESDACVFKKLDMPLYLLIYVDDGLVVGANEEMCDGVIRDLGKRFKTKRLSGEIFLGIEIRKTEFGLELSQRRYIDDILSRFNMTESEPSGTLFMDINSGTNVVDGPTKQPYRQAIGCLRHLAASTRPDIIFCVNTLAKFINDPKESHWLRVRQVLKYLKGTRDYSIRYFHDAVEIKAYSDAFWGGDSDNCCSTTGLILTMGGGPVVYASHKQTEIALSSTEAEYIAGSEAAREVAWLTQLLSELDHSYDRPRLFIDNESTIRLINNQDAKGRNKHINLRYHFIRQQLKNNLLSIKHIPSESQPADLLIQALSESKIEHLLDQLRMTRSNIKQVQREDSSIARNIQRK